MSFDDLFICWLLFVVVCCSLKCVALCSLSGVWFWLVGCRLLFDGCCMLFIACCSFVGCLLVVGLLPPFLVSLIVVYRGVFGIAF